MFLKNVHTIPIVMVVEQNHHYIFLAKDHHFRGICKFFETFQPLPHSRFSAVSSHTDDKQTPLSCRKDLLFCDGFAICMKQWVISSEKVVIEIGSNLHFLKKTGFKSQLIREMLGKAALTILPRLHTYVMLMNRWLFPTPTSMQILILANMIINTS